MPLSSAFFMPSETACLHAAQSATNQEYMAFQVYKFCLVKGSYSPRRPEARNALKSTTTDLVGGLNNLVLRTLIKQDKVVALFD